MDCKYKLLRPAVQVFLASNVNIVKIRKTSLVVLVGCQRRESSVEKT